MTASAGLVPSGARLGSVPVFPAPRAPTRTVQAAVAYPEGILFDFARGDVVLDGAGRPVRCDGWTAWAQWCLKAALTQRTQSIAVTRRYGLDAANVRSQPTRAAQEAVLAAGLVRALKRDRRTLDVRAFRFTWGGDGVEVHAMVVPRTGTPVRLAVEVTTLLRSPGGPGGAG